MTLTIFTVVGSLYLAWYYIKLINKIEKLEERCDTHWKHFGNYLTKNEANEFIKKYVTCDDTGLVCLREKAHEITVVDCFGDTKKEHYAQPKSYTRVDRSVFSDKVRYFLDNVEVTEKGKVVKKK